jgi:glycosyltransferase involved in cell wall biosynthesis
MLVEIIIPTYYRPEKLKCMLASLIAQTDGDWGAHVLIDNPEDEEICRLVDEFRDPRIRWTKMPQRYNDWGHTPREIGKQQSEADYVIMSGDDNYYIPILVEEIRRASNDRPGMIYWDMVHSHYRYSYFKCAPHIQQIDMGAFATRQDLAKSIALNTTFAADGEFVEAFKLTYPFEWIVKIQKVLFVHN